MSREFSKLYSEVGRPSIAPEKLLRALLLMVLYSIRSERRLMEEDDSGPKPPADDPGNPMIDFKGEKRRNDTHASKTDEDSRLARKGNGQEAKLAYCGNVMIENRHGLVVDVEVLQANGTAERDAALLMAERIAGADRITVAGDKGYHTKDFVKELLGMNVTLNVAQNAGRPGGSAIDARTTRHDGYRVSQQRRKIVEEAFGWMKTVGGQERPSTEVCGESDGSSPSRPQLATWCACGR